MPRPGLCLALLCSAAVLSSASAIAREKGVIVDPASPAGKEYSMPLEAGRDQQRGTRDGESAAQAGGSGSSSPVPHGDNLPGANGRKHVLRRKDRKAGKGSSRDPQGFLGGPGPDGGNDASGGGSEGAGRNAVLLTSGVALAVLLLGGGIALLMRRGAFGTEV